MTSTGNCNELLPQKVKESGISAALRASNLQIIDAAQPPLDPSGPNLRFASLFGLLSLGLTGGIVFVSMRERLSSFIVAPGDAAFHLSLPELGLIPASSIDKGGPDDYRDSSGRKRFAALTSGTLTRQCLPRKSQITDCGGVSGFVDFDSVCRSQTPLRCSYRGQSGSR